MSLLDDVSVVLTPNGYKAGTLYGVIPSSGAADMDVTRSTAATRINESGLVEDILSNVPRIDYTGGGCPHILAEPQSTNLVTYSEDFSQWIVSSVDTNVVTSPNGQTTADRINFSASNQLCRFITSSGDPDGKSFTSSVFLKADTSTSVKMIILGSGGGLGFLSQTVTLTNEWQRFSLSQSFSGTGDNVRLRLESTEAGSIFAWGGQIEEKSFATSYIATSGSTVTRNQDKFIRTGAVGLINSTEGVLFIEMASLANDGSVRRIALSDGTGNNRTNISFNTGNNALQCFAFVGGVLQYNLTTTITDATVFNKIAIKYKANDAALWVNGVEVATDTSVTTWPADTLTEFAFANNSQYAEQFFGKVRQLQIYKTALTDAQLTSLTT